MFDETVEPYFHDTFIALTEAHIAVHGNLITFFNLITWLLKQKTQIT